MSSLDELANNTDKTAETLEYDEYCGTVKKIFGDDWEHFPIRKPEDQAIEHISSSNNEIFIKIIDEAKALSMGPIPSINAGSVVTLLTNMRDIVSSILEKWPPESEAVLPWVGIEDSLGQEGTRQMMRAVELGVLIISHTLRAIRSQQTIPHPQLYEDIKTLMQGVESFWPIIQRIYHNEYSPTTLIKKADHELIG